MKREVTDDEVKRTQALTNTLLMLASTEDSHIVLGSLLMAAAIGGAAMKVSVEELSSLFDTTIEEVYTANAAVKAGLN